MQELEGGKEGALGANINYLPNSSLGQGSSYHPIFNMLFFLKKESLKEKDNKESWVFTCQNSVWRNANATRWSYLGLCSLICETAFVNFSQ